MPCLLRIAILVVSLMTIVSVVATVPDLGVLVVEKITAGGMWTALAVFIIAAVIFGAWPRDGRGAAGSPPPPGGKPR